MGKPTLSNQDKNVIDWHKQHNPVIKFIRNKNAISFQPGDILIKEERMGDTWNVVCVSPRSQVAKKYMFMHEDEYGVGYVKQLKAGTDEYVHNITCLASVDHDRVRFQVDPEYATHIIINGEGTYDHSVEYKLSKERSEKVRQDNTKLMVKPQHAALDINTILRAFNVGDKFWVAANVSGDNRQELEVIHKDENFGIGSDVYGFNTCRLLVKDDKGVTQLISCDRLYNLIFKSKPWKAEDLL